MLVMKGARAEAAAPDDGGGDGKAAGGAPAASAQRREASVGAPARHDDGPEAAAVTSSASALRRSRRARRAHATLEDEALSACGALLGSIEALAFELSDEPGARAERALADARRFGASVRDQLEALSWLALPELRTSTQRAPFPVARWLEHACRGALPRVHGLGSSLRWPSAGELGALSVELAVSRMDRALTVMIEQLCEAAGEGASLCVEVVALHDSVQILLSARAVPGRETGAEPASPLLVRAWQALLAFHGGAFEVDAAALTFRCTVPRHS